MGTQQQAGARRLYAADVPADESQLRLENQRLRDRVEYLEGMIKALGAAVVGSVQEILATMEATRLTDDDD